MSSSSVGLNRKPSGREFKVKTAMAKQLEGERQSGWGKMKKEK